MEKAKYPICRNMLNSSGKYNLQNPLNNLGAGSRWSVVLLLEESERGVYRKDCNKKKLRTVMPMAVGSWVRLFLLAAWTVLLIFMKSEKFYEICEFKKLQHWKLANDLQSAGRKRSWSSTWHLFLKFYNQGSFCDRAKLTHSRLICRDEGSVPGLERHPAGESGSPL